MGATQKETAIDEQQHSSETLICQRNQTILRILTTAATVITVASSRTLFSDLVYCNGYVKTSTLLTVSNLHGIIAEINFLKTTGC
jgi:hypothetical protein